MNTQERHELAKKIMEDCLDILQKKGKDYAGDEDILANFKGAAAELGLTKYQVWLTYWYKHVASVMNSIRTSPSYPQVESEPMLGRIHDIINYTIILAALLQEDEKGFYAATADLSFPPVNFPNKEDEIKLAF